MRILAIDHGSARVGYAVSDPTETLASPVGVLTPDPEAVARAAREQGAELIVVGLPLSLSGEEGEQARIARRFARSLAELVEIPVETYDERLTTRLADSSRRAGADAPPDALAAAHLLQSYLEHRAARRGSAQ